METGSVLENEHFMVCFLAEMYKMSTLPVTFLFRFMFQLSNRLAGFDENCYEFFTVGKYPYMVRTAVCVLLGISPASEV